VGQHSHGVGGPWKCLPCIIWHPMIITYVLTAPSPYVPACVLRLHTHVSSASARIVIANLGVVCGQLCGHLAIHSCTCERMFPLCSIHRDLCTNHLCLHTQQWHMVKPLCFCNGATCAVAGVFGCWHVVCGPLTVCRDLCLYGWWGLWRLCACDCGSNGCILNYLGLGFWTSRSGLRNHW
jgi:hypothetical protein